MTADPQDLPPLDLLIRRLPKYMIDTESARESLKEMCVPLLSKIAEFTKHFDEVDREIDELEEMVQKVKQQAEAAEREVAIERQYATTSKQLAERAQKERDELRAKLEAAQKDAERYQWLRDEAAEAPSGTPTAVRLLGVAERDMLQGEELDAAIDAARAEKP